MIDIELNDQRPQRAAWKPNDRRTSDRVYRRKVAYRQKQNSALIPEPINPHFAEHLVSERGEAQIKAIYARIEETA